MMEELGHDVEVDSVFDSALGLRDVLKERIEA
jgi:hypothetical protein